MDDQSSMQKLLPPPDKVITDAADLARIGSEQRERYRLLIHGVFLWAAEPFVPQRYIPRDSNNDLVKLKELASAFAAALDGLDARTEKWFNLLARTRRSSLRRMRTALAQFLETTDRSLFSLAEIKSVMVG